MDLTAAPEFYTGLVSELYGALRGVDPDPEPYARFIATNGEPALELGCGDGDPLLDLVQRGLEVEGVDSSADMLARCRRRAAERGVDVVLHHTTMEAMDLRRRYRTIFLAGATFNLLPTDDVVEAALTAIGRHLADGGRAMIPLFVPEPVHDDALGVPVERRPDERTVLRCSTIASRRDASARLQVDLLRYERERDGEIEVLEREWVLHWHSPEHFAALVGAAGLAVDGVVEPGGAPATAASRSFVFVVSREAPDA